MTNEDATVPPPAKGEDATLPPRKERADGDAAPRGDLDGPAIHASLYVSPDGRHLAIASSSEPSFLWDAINKQSLLSFESEAGPPIAVRFSRDGNSLAWVTGEGQVTRKAGERP